MKVEHEITRYRVCVNGLEFDNLCGLQIQDYHGGFDLKCTEIFGVDMGRFSLLN